MATVVPASTERKTKLANLLAVLARQAHVIGNGTHPPNEYLVAMDQNVRELEAFSAVIYSSNFELELLGASKTAAAEVGDSAEFEPVSASFADVMVEKEPGTPSEDIAQSVPVLVDNDVQELETVSPVEQSASEAVTDSAFEQAWGKAVEDGKSPSETEEQATS
jgi:peroxin-3